MPRNMILPEGVHRTRAKLASGKHKYYFSLRGRKGTGFWSSSDPYPRSADFFEAYSRAVSEAKPKVVLKSNADVIAEYRASANFRKLKPRTQTDYVRCLLYTSPSPRDRG